MYLNSFVPKAKHNCGCISQVCIYKGIFRFWTALCGLLGDKCSIASSCLVHKTSTVHMEFFNSHRGAKQLLRQANNPRNGAKQVLRDSKQLLRETNKPSNEAIDLFSLYILFSHFRPRDVTRGNSFFQISASARANLRITNEKTKGKFP